MRTKKLYRISYCYSADGKESIMYVSGRDVIDALTTFHYCKGAHMDPIEIRFISENFAEMIVEHDQV